MDKIFLGKYRVSSDEIEAVGDDNGRSAAYEAREISSGKKVVVESIPVPPLKPAERERLETEAIALKKIRHVNIPALYDFGVEDDHLIYATEEFDGTLAEEWVNAQGPLPIGPVLRIASQVVSALGVAALYQIGHQAINPANLVLVAGQTAEGDWPLVKILHFGSVTPTATSDTSGAVAEFDKSLHYVSPEQIQKGTVDFRSEVYSLGCTMWFLLTGAPPLVGPKGPTAVTPANSRWKVKAMPRKVGRLLASMLSPNPAARPRDPVDFYRKLQDCLIQVERREARAMAFGAVSLPRASTPVIGSRRAPAKALAFAAVFLASAALAAVLIPSYLRHHRVITAEEPIGVPIGVPSTAVASPPTVTTSTTPLDAGSRVAANPAQPNAAAQPGRVESSENTVSASTPITASETNESRLTSSQGVGGVAEARIASPPPEENVEASSTNPPPTDPIASNRTEPANDASRANTSASIQDNTAKRDNANALPSTNEPAQGGVENHVAVQPPGSSTQPLGDSITEPLSKPQVDSSTNIAADPSKRARKDVTESNSASARPPPIVAQHSGRKGTVPHEVRRAEPIEPEVRRAEPIAPGEGPMTEETEQIVPSNPQVNSRVHPEDRDEPVTELDERASRSENNADSDSASVTQPQTKDERSKKTKRRNEERVYPAQPGTESGGRSSRRFRARFIGVTPDGMWMFQLPSHRIVVVPPPDR